MSGMTSRAAAARSRKRPEERREEILSVAAEIAVAAGLERVTLRAVAERLGVRPGLITHYFPAAEDLVVEAFARAAVLEREQFFPTDGEPLRRLAHFVGHIEQGVSIPLARLWLNARHLVRFIPALEAVLHEQDALDHARGRAIVEDGIASGDFGAVDAEVACIRILLAVDGGGSYVNTAAERTHPAHRRMVADVAAWALALEPERLRAAIDREAESAARASG